MVSVERLQKIIDLLDFLPDKYSNLKYSFDFDKFAKTVRYKSLTKLTKYIVVYLSDLSIENSQYISVRKLAELYNVNRKEMSKIKIDLLDAGLIKNRDLSHLIRETGDFIILLNRFGVIDDNIRQKALLSAREIILHQEILIRSHHTIQYSYAAISSVSDVRIDEMSKKYAEILSNHDKYFFYQIFFRINEQLKHSEYKPEIMATVST